MSTPNPAEVIAEESTPYPLSLRRTPMADNAIGTVLDIGAPEPADDVIAVESMHFDDIDEHDSGVALRFGRTYRGEWKGYLFGGKTYYGWDELVRRFGPVRVTALAAEEEKP